MNLGPTKYPLDPDQPLYELPFGYNELVRDGFSRWRKADLDAMKAKVKEEADEEADEELPPMESINMNKQELGKKVFLDTLTDLPTVLSAVAGATAIIVGWAIGSRGIIFSGIMPILFGLGWAATRFIFGFDKQLEKTLEKIQAEQEKRQEQLLNLISKKLAREKDARTRQALQEARDMYAQFMLDRQQGVYESHEDVAQKVEELFKSCVKQIERSYKLSTVARSVPERMKLQILSDRNEVIREIQAAVESLGTTVQAFHQFTADEGAAELARLREELDISLDVAKQTEEQMSALDTRLATKRRCVSGS